MANGTTELAPGLADLHALLLQPEPQPRRLPGPGDVPQTLHHPKVLAATGRKTELVTQLAAVESEVATVAAQLGVGTEVGERQLRAKLILAGQSDEAVTAAVRRRQELSDRAAVLGEAVNLAEAAVQAARQEVVKELAPKVRETVFQPAARAAALAYLDFVMAADRVREIVLAAQGAGLNYDLQTVGGDRVPADARDRYQLRGTLGGLIGRGLVTRAEVENVFPGMFEGYAPGREAG